MAVCEYVCVWRGDRWNFLQFCSLFNPQEAIGMAWESTESKPFLCFAAMLRFQMDRVSDLLSLY